MKRFACLALVAAAVMVMGIGIASAQNEPKEPMEVQGYFGSYGPGPDAFEDEVTWGGRFGWRLTEGFIIEAGLGSVSLDGEFEEGSSRIDFDGDLVFFEGGINWVWWPHRVLSPEVFGGMGWVVANVDSHSEGPRVDVDVEDLTDDSYTLNAGVGLRVNFGESPFFLDGRWKYRWFENRSSDTADRELTVAFGWAF
jgi:hypothetical protein